MNRVNSRNDCHDDSTTNIVVVIIIIIIIIIIAQHDTYNVILSCIEVALILVTFFQQHRQLVHSLRVDSDL